MTDVPVHRCCRLCGARLAHDNAEVYCGPCSPALRSGGPPEMPGDFWDAGPVRDALASRHMGRVIAAYRNHPFHGRPLRQKTVAAWVLMAQPQLSRLENGPPIQDLDKLILWANILRIPARLLWFKLPSDAAGKRADASQTRLPGSPSDDALAIPASPRLSSATIKALESSIADYWRRDDQYGGEALRPAVLAQLRLVLNLLAECQREDQRRSLTGIAAELARLAGWMAFDARQYRAASACFEESLRLAKELDDRPFIANVLACLSLQATYEDNPADALALARTAQDTCRSAATPRVMAMLSMREAFAHAVFRDTAGCHTAISEAHAHFANIDAADQEPAWVAYFDHVKLTADTGIALSRLGDHRAAEPMIADALERQHPGNSRPRAFHMFWLASTLLRAGDLDQACATATGMLELVGSVDSARITGHIQEFQRSLAPFAAEPVTQDFNALATEFFNDSPLSLRGPTTHTAAPPRTRC